MQDRMRDYGHLVRLALLFVAAFGVFLVVRALFVPDTFGDLGHYRAAALDDNRRHPLVFAGASACEACHAPAFEEKDGGAHANVRCEACHGALGSHATDPTAAAAVRPGVPSLCLGCHLVNAARPRGFPQIDPKEHYGDACGECHRPHHPDAK